MSASEVPSRRFALASRRVVFPDAVRPAKILIADSKIVEILDYATTTADVPCEDLGDLVIAPGVVDAHVHINEPGRSEWEGFASATQAAAAGGVTTLVDMPLNSSPTTTTVAALEAKREAATGQCWVDVGLYGGLIPDNGESIEPLLAAGVLGIKAFLCPSGLEEFPQARLADLQAAAPTLVRFGRPLLVHAELTNAPAPQPATARRYVDYLATRPVEWETDAVAMMLAVLESRLSNEESAELQLAAAEQLKITLLRLRKLVS
jgi:allantoinase